LRAICPSTGRRPIDDVVDTTPVGCHGRLAATTAGAPWIRIPPPTSRQLGYTDGVQANPANFLTVFPLEHAVVGSPNF
jgi:hypothetical protein